MPSYDMDAYVKVTSLSSLVEESEHVWSYTVSMYPGFGRAVRVYKDGWLISLEFHRWNRTCHKVGRAKLQELTG